MINSDNKDDMVNYLCNTGFMGYFFQHAGYTTAECKCRDSEDYLHCWFIRLIPGGVTLTAATRAKGIAVLTQFFQDTNCNQCPPHSIRTRDVTASPCQSMNNYFMDGDILAMMDIMFKEEHLTPGFAQMFPAMAAQIFAGPRFPI